MSDEAKAQIEAQIAAHCAAEIERDPLSAFEVEAVGDEGGAVKLKAKEWARVGITDATLEVVAREFGERLQSLNLYVVYGCKKVAQADRAARRRAPQLTRGRRALLRPTR